MKISLFQMSLALLVGTATSVSAEPASFHFPDTPDGRRVLAADYHVHTVFSDGSVWPTIRVREAIDEGISVLSLTEHVELTVNRNDLAKTDGLVDKNRSFIIASEYATERRRTSEQADVTVIQGAEITRGFGHYNCIFTSDNNQLRTPGRETDPDVLTDTDARSFTETVNALREANDQGGFCFWNHPYAPGQDQGSMAPGRLHRQLIANHLIQGVEVANSNAIFYDAIDTAMEYDLAMFANSDIHLAADWNEGDHRTVTLVLADEASDTAIRRAMDDRQTVALFNNTLIGRSEPVSQIVEGALSVSLLPPISGWHVSLYPIRIENRSSMPFTIEMDRKLTPFTSTHMLTVPANSIENVVMFRKPDEAAGFKARILNSHVDGGERASVVLTFQ